MALSSEDTSSIEHLDCIIDAAVRGVEDCLNGREGRHRDEGSSVRMGGARRFLPRKTVVFIEGRTYALTVEEF